MHAQSNLSLPVTAALLLASCIEQAYQEGAGLAPKDTGTSGSSTGEPGLPTTSSAGEGVQTVTGAESTSPGGEGSSAGDETGTGGHLDLPANAPPVIESFTADPPHMSEAGASTLELKASADVVLVRLRLNGALVLEGPPKKFPYDHHVLSAKHNFGHTFEVEVEDAEGLTATATAELTVQLPPSGAEKCLFKDVGAQASVISGLVYTRKAIYATGARDVGAGFKLTVWALDPDHCEDVLPGWPKTLENWTAKPGLAALASSGAAITVDESGNLGVGGNLVVNGKPQPYVALLTPNGARLWENEGAVGEELAGLAAFTDQFSNRLVGVGWRRTSENPVRTDAMTWVYHALDGGVFVSSSTLKAPFTPDEQPDLANQHSEWARAVVVKGGVAFVVGEREREDGDNFTYRRAFLARLHPLGSVEPLWTSWGVHAINDAARSLAMCGEKLVAGGWDRAKPADAKPEPLLLWFEPDGSFIEHRPDALVWAQTNGVACDLEGKILSAGSRMSGDGDAQVFAVTGPFDQRAWYEAGVAGPDGAGAVACDTRGVCAAGGFRAINGKPYAIVRVFHP